MRFHAARSAAGGFSRRSGALAGARLDANAKKGMRIDIHAHLWTDDYLDLTQSYGNTDTGTQRNKGAGMGQAEIEKRFALMEANGVEMQILSICPQAPHFEIKEHAVNAARKANDLYAEAVSRWPKKFKAFAASALASRRRSAPGARTRARSIEICRRDDRDVYRPSLRRRFRLRSVL
jgi:predicted TIM-barrel fold metal-dependent hydrolase